MRVIRDFITKPCIFTLAWEFFFEKKKRAYIENKPDPTQYQKSSSGAQIDANEFPDDTSHSQRAPSDGR